MVLGCYVPVVMVEYNRMAYVCPQYDTRITFDSEVKYSESNFDLFYKQPLYNTVLMIE